MMQSLEIDDDDAIGRNDEGNEMIFLTTTATNNRNRRRQKVPSSLVSLSSSSSLLPLRSRTTRERQCCAMAMIVFGVFVSTSIVFNIGRNYHPPWYYYQGKTKFSGYPLSDLLKNPATNDTATTTVSNVTGVVQNNTQSPENHSKVVL
jgi:hypothetical protein